MKIGIIAALDIEIDDLKEKLENTNTVKKGSVDFTLGKLHGNDIVAAESGVGKVCAAMCTQTVILEFGVDKIINIGVAGTLDKDIGVLDIAIAKDMVQHDMDISGYQDEPVGLIETLGLIHIPTDKDMLEVMESCAREAEREYKVGTIVTGDQFITEPEKKSWLHENFGGIACEMEGGAIAQVCYMNKVPYLVLRTISDGEGAAMDFDKFAEEAAKVAIDLIEVFIEKVA